MAAYYLDTSALVKTYAREAGTAWVAALVDPARDHILYTVRLTGPEMVAALGRKARTGELTASAAARAIGAFRRSWRRRSYVVAMTVILAERAMDLAERYGPRGYDAVHLAAALTIADRQRDVGLPQLTFVSADTEQRRAAVAEGLLVEDPNAFT